VPNSYEYV